MSAIALSFDETSRQEDMLKYNTLILSSMTVSSSEERDLISAYHFLHDKNLFFQPQWVRRIEKTSAIRMEYERSDSSFLFFDFKGNEISYIIETSDGQTFSAKCSNVAEAASVVNDFYYCAH